MSTPLIKSLMRARYPSNEWALAFEVGNATGSSTRRHADAVAMNLWPSRGLAIHGFEFKSYRSDWQRELQKPEKAEAVSQYCDYWWLVTTPDIVRDGELPDSWGLMEVRSGKLVVVKQAEKREAVPVTRSFMAALFRRISEADHAEVELAARKLAEELDVSRRASFEDRVRERTRDFDHLKERVKAFEEHSGFNLEDWETHPAELGKAVKFVLDNQIFGSYGTIDALRNTLQNTVNVMNKVFEAHNEGAEYVKTWEPLAKRRAKSRRS